MEKIFSAAEIAELVSAAAVKGDPGKTVNGVNSLRLAKENENYRFIDFIDFKLPVCLHMPLNKRE